MIGKTAYMIGIIAVLCILVSGCTGTQTQNTVYVCSNGSQVADASLCSVQTGGQGGGQAGNPPAQNTSGTGGTGQASDYTAAMCISNTRDNPQCKDCCDCLSGADGDARTSCRDTCATHDFSKNGNFINFSAPSVLGQNGDYSECVEKGSSGECKSCCEESMGLQCGDYRFCRTACNNEYGDSKDTSGGNTPPEPPKENASQGQGSQYNIEQAISDRAQLSTLSFSALAFTTGDACSDSFLPPGKVADFSGFQYLRDNDPDMMGHNTEFVTMAADNVLTILTEDQISEFIAIDPGQTSMSDEYGYMRFPLMNAFRRQLTGDMPDGSSGLNRTAVMEYSARLYRLDANISLQRAEAFGRVYRSLTTGQRAYLDSMKAGGSLSWPKVSEPAILKTSGISSVDLRTYASEFFSWYAGSVEADTYFCPERQATYFGSFYMKDAPAMGNRNYSISTSITGDKGEGFLNLLDSAQRSELTGLVDTQRSDLNDIVSTRQAIATELRKLMAQDSINDSLVLSLGERYGELDGEISYYYATRFSQVGQSLTDGQEAGAMELRDLEDFKCEGAYLYSEKIAMPEVGDTDFLFNSG